MPNTVRHVFILAWYYFTTAASCREQSISLRVVELCSCIFLLYALAPFSSSFLPLLLAKIRPSTFPLILIFIPTFKLCSATSSTGHTSADNVHDLDSPSLPETTLHFFLSSPPLYANRSRNFSPLLICVCAT